MTTPETAREKIRDGAREALKDVDAGIYRGAEDHVLKAVVAFTLRIIDAAHARHAEEMREARRVLQGLVDGDEPYLLSSAARDFLAPADSPAPEAKVEPVEYRYRLTDNPRSEWQHVDASGWALHVERYREAGWTVEPLYTHPPVPAPETPEDRQAKIVAWLRSPPATTAVPQWWNYAPFIAHAIEAGYYRRPSPTTPEAG